MSVKAVFFFFATLFLFGTPAHAQVLDGFAWVDLKTDSTTVAAVTKALASQKYTALREVGLAGGQALVITATRSDPIAQPRQDRFNVYGVSLKEGTAEPVLDGAQLRIVEWQKFYDEDAPELLATYDDCSNCQPTTFLTAFYLDRQTKKWRARWPRGVSGAPLASSGTSSGGRGESVYALFMNVDQRVVLDTWVRYPPQRGAQKGSSRGVEYLFEYHVDPASYQGVARPLAARDAAAAKQRLCKGESVVFGIAAGQQSEACRGLFHRPGPPSPHGSTGTAHAGGDAPVPASGKN